MRKIILFLAAFVILSISVFGCGRKDQNDENSGQAEFWSTQENLSMDQQSREDISDTENTSQLQLGSAVEIPESFAGQPAEISAHGQLEKAIAEYSGIAEEDYGNVRYYYNYVDLNKDGKNEILALVWGQEAEGIDGNMLLWLDEAETEKVSAGSVKQVFHQVGMPVYISDHMTQGYRDLIITDQMLPADIEEVAAGNAGRTVDGEPTSLQKTAGLDETTGDNGATPISGERTYMLLTWKGSKYQEYEEGTALPDLEGYGGTAVLTSHMESDAAGDHYHFLGEAMQ